MSTGTPAAHFLKYFLCCDGRKHQLFGEMLPIRTFPGSRKESVLDMQGGNFIENLAHNALKEGDSCNISNQ